MAPSPLGEASRLNLRFNVGPSKLSTQHVHLQHLVTESFLVVKPGHPYDAGMAQRSLKVMGLFDVDENVLVVVAHDYTLGAILHYWPETANQ